MAALYEEGQGVAKDLARAFMWYTLASETYASPKNKNFAVLDANALKPKMKPLQIAEAEILRKRWHANRGVPPAGVH